MGHFNMMGYQGVRLLRLCKAFQEKSSCNFVFGSNNSSMKQQIRWHSSSLRLSYRKLLMACEEDVKMANKFGAFFWWWITYNILTADYEEFFGPHLPDPSKWTDEELGIPPLDD